MFINASNNNFSCWHEDQVKIKKKYEEIFERLIYIS